MKNRLSPTQVLHKMCRYCAYRERSYKEVKDRLSNYLLSREEDEQILTLLKQEQYIDDYRFVKAFVRGKFRIKKWGRVKIIRHLNTHELSPACIQQGLEEIEEADYKTTLEELVKKKGEQVQRTGQSNVRNKVGRYGIQKGYEKQLVWEVTDLFFPSRR